MTAPVVRGTTAPAAGGSVTSPAGTEIGDLVVVYTWERLGAAAGSSLTVNSGAGFTQIRNHFHDDSSTDGALAAAYKVATAAGAQSYQGFTSSSGAPAWWTGCLVLQKGTFNVDSLPPSNGATQTNNALPNPPSVTSLDNTRDYLVVAIAGWHLGSSATVTPTAPTNYGNLVHVAGSANGELACATRAISAATSEDPGTFGDDVAPNGSAIITIAFINQPERQATLSVTDAADTLAATVGLEVRGQLNVADDADAIAATLEMEGGELSAVVDVTDAADTLSTTAGLEIRAIAALADANDSLAAAAGLEIRATSAVTDAGDALVSAGTLEIRAGAALGDQADAIVATLELTGGPELSAVVNVTDAGDQLEAFAELEGGEAPVAAPLPAAGGPARRRLFRRRSVSVSPDIPRRRELADQVQPPPRHARVFVMDEDDELLAAAAVADSVKNIARRQALELLMLS